MKSAIPDTFSEQRIFRTGYKKIGNTDGYKKIGNTDAIVQ